MNVARPSPREAGLPRSRVFDLGVWGPSFFLLLLLGVPIAREGAPSSRGASTATVAASSVRPFLEARWGALLAEYRAGDREKDYERKNRAQQQLTREIQATNALGLEVVADLLAEERDPLAREFIYLAVATHGDVAIELFTERLAWLDEAALAGEAGSSDPALTPMLAEFEARSIFTALGLVGTDASFELLAGRLRLGDEPWLVRSLCALAMHPRGGEVTPIAIERLHDPEPGVRAAAALVLGHHPSEAGVDSLVQALARVDDFDTRLALIVALGRTGDATAAEPLLQILASDPNAKLREVAVDALALIVAEAVDTAEEVARRLAEHARSESAPRVRAKALEVARNVLGD